MARFDDNLGRRPATDSKSRQTTDQCTMELGGVEGPGRDGPVQPPSAHLPIRVASDGRPLDWVQTISRVGLHRSYQSHSRPGPGGGGGRSSSRRSGIRGAQRSPEALTSPGGHGDCPKAPRRNGPRTGSPHYGRCRCGAAPHRHGTPHPFSGPHHGPAVYFDWGLCFGL